MAYLLDTHTYLWFLCDDPKLSKRAKKEIENPNNSVYLSSSVVWEISIKAKIGKIALEIDLDTLISESIQQYNFIPLPITIPHAIKIYGLPEIHNDPFDRILVAQSILEKLSILTSDSYIKKYNVTTIW